MVFPFGPIHGIISAEGDYKGEHCAPVKLSVSGAVSLQVPLDDPDAIDKISIAKVPVEPGALKEKFEPTIEAALRSVLGRVTYEEARIELEDNRKAVERLLKKGDSSFRRSGFRRKDISIAISVDLPKDLEEAKSEVELQKHHTKAALYQAEKQGITQGRAVIESYAQSRGKTVKEIQQEIDTNSEEQGKFLEYAKERSLREREAELGALLHVVSNNAGIDIAAVLGRVFSQRTSGGGFPQRPGEKEAKKDERGWAGEELEIL